MIKAWYDGACGPINPGGHAGCGVHITENDHILYQEAYYIGFGPEMSNNVAEYFGLIRVLTYLIKHNRNKEKILCYGDSYLTIAQMTGKWKCKGGLYKPYYYQAIELLDSFPDITFYWIPRWQNEDADEMSKVAIEEKSMSAYNPSHAPITVGYGKDEFSVYRD